jgi:hypothetical protein
MLTLLSKGVPTKLFKFFFHLPPVSMTPVVNLELRIRYLREFSKKFEAALMVYSGAWGNRFMKKKKQKSKISWHCPFKYRQIFNRGMVWIFFSTGRSSFIQKDAFSNEGLGDQGRAEASWAVARAGGQKYSTTGRRLVCPHIGNYYLCRIKEGSTEREEKIE